MPSIYLTLITRKSQPPSGKTNVAGFSCIVSGIHDLLYIDYNAEVVELEAGASAEIYEYAKTFLTDRSALVRMDSIAYLLPLPKEKGAVSVLRVGYP